MRAKRIVALLLSAALLAGCSAFGSQSPIGAVHGARHRSSSSPIQHIVIIMQENRSFDNMFYGYPGANTATSGTGHDGTVYPLTPTNLAYAHDQNHYHYQFLLDYDSGKGDGFDQQIYGPIPKVYNPPKYCTKYLWVNYPQCYLIHGPPFNKEPYTYVLQAQVQPYWDMAKQYTLGDNTFSSNNGPTFPSHQYMIAGRSGHASDIPLGHYGQGPWGCDGPNEKELYLHSGSANPPVYDPVFGHEIVGPDPCFPIKMTGPDSTYTTIADELDNAGIGWRYYVQPKGQDSWWLNAFDAVKSIRYGPDWGNGDISSPDTNVLSDIDNGNLQQVSWVMPHGHASDHPGGGSGNCGPDWVAMIVNAIGKSQYWNSTAVIVMWDEWGGWYDHVLPPQYPDPITGANEGLGFRIPLLIVSPYAKAGYISHQQHEIASSIHFIEETFNLPFLGTGTKYQFADQRADGFDDVFDFTQKPIKFKAIKLAKEPRVTKPVKLPPCPKVNKDAETQVWPPEIDY
jgi:phospholipase C